MIMRLLDLADVLPGHVAPKCSLNLHNKCDMIGVSESAVCSILIVRRILDVVVVDLTITTTT